MSFLLYLLCKQVFDEIKDKVTDAGLFPLSEIFKEVIYILFSNT